jgi:hypothetical protein
MSLRRPETHSPRASQKMLSSRTLYVVLAKVTVHHLQKTEHWTQPGTATKCFQIFAGNVPTKRISDSSNLRKWDLSIQPPQAVLLTPRLFTRGGGGVHATFGAFGMRVRYLVSAGAVLAAVALYALHREEVTINVNKPPSAAVVSPSSRPLGRGDVYETLGHLFIVGDVHGCLNEMQQLVNTYRTENETLVFVGDMTMKGAKNLRSPRPLFSYGA